jgi:hypothetical protein
MSEATEQIAKHHALAMLASFGVTGTYMPVSGGGSRTITVAVDEDGDYAEVSNRLESQERLRVFVLRDKDNEQFGGIDAPTIGDVLLLERDSPYKPYSWRGGKANADRHSWTLIFVRELPHEIGGRRR